MPWLGKISGVTLLSSPIASPQCGWTQKKLVLPLRAAALLGVAVGMIAGCQSMETSPGTTAQLRVIAASPDAPGMDFYARGKALAYGMDFGSASSYVPLTAGNKVRLSATTANTAQTLVKTQAPLVAGRQYTAVVNNVAAGLEETIYPDKTQPAPNGQVELRIIDAATRAGGVDLYLVPSDGKLRTTLPVRTGLGFGGSTGYIIQPAGTYSLVVMPAGTTPLSSTPTLLIAPEVAYASGAVRTIVLVDRPKLSDPGVDEIVAEDYQPS